MSLTGLKDADREILKHIGDDELLKVCSTDKRMWNQVCDDSFIRRRLQKYSDVENYKENNSWKMFFLEVVHYVKIMKSRFTFQYIGGDFKKQWNILNSNVGRSLLHESISETELSLLKHAIEQISKYDKFAKDYALRISSMKGNLEAMKLLIECGANIHVGENFPLRNSVFHKRLKIVKYLISKGADVHAVNNEIFQTACENNDLEMIEYLEKYK